jgi:ankyrin repeat protein
MAAQEGYLRVVKLLIKVKGIRVNLQCSLEDATPHGMDCATPLYIASARGHHQVVKVLLTKKGINVNRGTRNLVAIQHHHIKGTLKIIQLLLSSSSIDVNQPDPDMFTPLYIACQDGHDSGQSSD